MPELCGDVAALLADTNWWVRTAAKESLLALGADGFVVAVAALEREDGSGGEREASTLLATIEERRTGRRGEPVKPATSPHGPARVAA